MKILHTSDWHLGQVFHDYDRLFEQEDMLQQITEIVKDEQPDAMIICGDIYDTATPSIKAVELYNRYIIRMQKASPTMKIVVTAGNHDSAQRLEMNNALWDCLSVSVIGGISKTQDEKRTPLYDKHIITVYGTDDKPKGYIVAVPYCNEYNFPTERQGVAKEQRMHEYFTGLLNRVNQLNQCQLPIVVMAHTTVQDSDISAHSNIGGVDRRDISDFGKGYDYLALGHIHTPQTIHGIVRYSGTPIPVNFSEKFKHSVSIVEVQHGMLPIIQEREIKNKIPLHDFPTQLPDSDAVEEMLEESKRPKPFNEVIEALRKFPADELCYLRIVVKADKSLTSLANALVADAVKDKKCRVCHIQPFSFKKNEDTQEAKTIKLSSKELKRKSPLEIAELFFEINKIKLSDRQKQIIREVTEEASQE